MSRQIPSLHFVGGADSPRVAAVLAAGRTAGLEGAFRGSLDLPTAIAASRRLEVLVLLDPQMEDIKAALETRDERGLPQWAVVPSSFEEAQSAEFADARWEVEKLANAIRSAVAMLDLRRENTRLRGDLCTIGRRLTHDLRKPFELDQHD